MNIKTVSMNDLPESAWQYITGKPADSDDLSTYYRAVPWLFRGVGLRANAVSTMPFSVFRGEQEIDNSDEYKNAVKFLPKPGALFGLIEAALTIFGYAYLFKLKSVYMQKGLRYLDPTSVTYKINDETGEVNFSRIVGGKTTKYTADDIVYFWQYDPFVEIGAPQASPAKSASLAAGVLLNIDAFAKAFFEHGAVKTTLLTTTNIQPAERDRLKLWWRRVLGIEKAWQTDIVNAETVKPIVVGEGLESLQNNDLTESKRIDIAAGLGIPYSILFSNASNRATAEADDTHFYDKTIVPECKFIESILNDQVFAPAGYSFKFTPQNLDIYQEDENERAESLEIIITALGTPEEFLLAADILGYDLNMDTRKAIKALIKKKQKAPEVIEQQLTEPPKQEEPEPEEEEPEPPKPNMRAIDLEKWRTKALKRVKAKRPMEFSFVTEHIDPVTHAAISGALEQCETEDDVKAVFTDLWIGYP